MEADIKGDWVWCGCIYITLWQEIPLKLIIYASLEKIFLLNFLFLNEIMLFNTFVVILDCLFHCLHQPTQGQRYFE